MGPAPSTMSSADLRLRASAVRYRNLKAHHARQPRRPFGHERIHLHAAEAVAGRTRTSVPASTAAASSFSGRIPMPNPAYMASARTRLSSASKLPATRTLDVALWSMRRHRSAVDELQCEGTRARPGPTGPWGGDARRSSVVLRPVTMRRCAGDGPPGGCPLQADVYHDVETTADRVDRRVSRPASPGALPGSPRGSPRCLTGCLGCRHRLASPHGSHPSVHPVRT